MSNIDAAPWAVGEYVSVRVSPGVRYRGQIMALRYDDDQWLFEVMPCHRGAVRATVSADEIWPDA